MRTDIDMSNLSQYITDLTNGCSYLDQLVSGGSTDTTRINEVIRGIEYQLTLKVVAESSEDLTSFVLSVDSAKKYLEEI
jgi:hypothetical protein